jgi:hypothetical protein
MGKTTLTLPFYPLKRSREPYSYLFVAFHPLTLTRKGYGIRGSPVGFRTPEEGQGSACADFFRDKGMGGFVTSERVMPQFIKATRQLIGCFVNHLLSPPKHAR